MRLDEIKRNAAKALNITQFNDMQRAVAACRADQLVLLAPTGSGKTLAFATALLMRLGAPATHAMAVVIAPSRELAQQIHSVLRPLATGYKVAVMYGGSQFATEVSSIQGAVPQIVIATPGRLLDHLNRHTLDIAQATALVVDEYDKTLELGFQDEVSRIVRRMRARKFTALTSATPIAEMPPFIHADKAEVINAGDIATAPQLTVIEVPSAVPDKLDTLAALLRTGLGQAMVFVNHRESAERVVRGLRERGIAAALYHGGLEQQRREMAVAAFRAHAVPVLVATDLAARGLDIAGVDAVVHYHLPVDEQAWTHRNGRTARAGATGNVYVITGPDEALASYIRPDHPLYPAMDAGTAPVETQWTLLYINAGKHQKVSRGDIAGFVMKQCGMAKEDVGLITVAADYSTVAVRPADAPRVIAAARAAKLKGQRVRVTPIS